MLEALYKKNKKGRFDALMCIVSGIFIILIIRLFYLQIMDGEYITPRRKVTVCAWCR